MIVFVHGVPETAAIWDKVRALVHRPSVAVALPGFGCPRPEGFGATGDDYVDWLVGELDRIDEPIDLVGHDWGALLALRVATARGDRLRSWAMDVGSCAHPGYQWHSIAQLWQTPGDGEAFVESQNRLPVGERAAGLEAMGVPPDDAAVMAAAADATMGGCILDLYRSATPNPHRRWGPWPTTAAPGLVLHATEDPFSAAPQAAEVAAAVGARFQLLEGAGHFWPCQAPTTAAALLEGFWASVR